MTATHKPSGYTSVAPYLLVEGAARTIDFLVRVFGAQELRRMPAPDGRGRVAHAEVRIDDTVVMLADAGEDSPMVAAHVHVYVPDVDVTHRRALAAGATEVRPPLKGEDEDRRSGVRDPGGTTWWIGTRVG
jgi:uncharacterized glyoxalase superfamily protein PhnB